HRRQAAVDFLIDHQHGQTFLGSAGGGKWAALTNRIAAVDERAACTLVEFLDRDVLLPSVDFAPAPRAERELERRANPADGTHPFTLTVCELDGFGALLGGV